MGIFFLINFFFLNGCEFDGQAAEPMDISPRNFSNLLSYCKLAGKFCSFAV